MPPPTLYPRAQLKKTIKAHTNRPLSRSVDILIFLNYTLFLQELVKEAAITSKQAGERGITAKSVRKVRADVLRKFKA
ncbi:hypothetical protein K505DRAFT_314098 [Melanomma pulvis-pyrius CBS 109.77]|uniref:Transcription factor CBF/NF-Y/archaeal histone domain-containing protein n=1 Tax=Melanomma pulvis-pyrius CBS 109.77 TaxID=1314802 RepID=A0A6A6WY72_9PLEO|nr:hypothetical protein K505DRAFT_314098 [Melanomma pulvis-pyrius CBS 109.77]